MRPHSELGDSSPRAETRQGDSITVRGVTCCGPLRTAAWLLFLLPAAFPWNWGSFGEPAYLLRNALLIDGSGREPKASIDILIQDGVVAGIGPAESLGAPEGIVVFDATGKTVVPGIINGRGLAGLVRSEDLPPNHFTEAGTIAHLRTYASYGVTTTSTLGPDPETLTRIREDVRSGATRSAARVVTPLRALTASKPLPDRFPGLESVFEVVGSPEEAREAVDLLAEQGADYIEFRSGSVAVTPAENRAIAEAAIARARHHELRAAVVARDESLVLAAVQAGARTVAGSLVEADVSEELIGMLAETGTVYLPALSAELVEFQFGDVAPFLADRYLRRSLVSGVTGILRGPEHIRQALDPDRALRIRQFDAARHNLRRIEAAGVTIGLASGSGFSGTFEGYSEYREAALTKQAGMSGIDVIRAFSSSSAKALGVDRERGAVRPGVLADIVILNANPLENIHNLRELHAVFVGGKLARL